MNRKFYTIDDLYDFCKTNRFEKFSSTEQGAPLIIQSFGTFETTNHETDGLLSVKLKSCHTGKNRNKSGISDATMALYKNSFKGRPILGAIYKTDTGEYEFRAHDMEIVETDDGVDVEYIEQPIGVVSQIDEPYLEFDEKEDKNYLMVNGTIFSDYSKAAEILERRRTCKCSVEIAVEEFSYNCDEDYLSIDKFRFSGVTILGYEQDGVTEIQEGMKGSKITIDSFSTKNNSIFAENYQDKMIEVLDKLNEILANFNTNTTQKGGEKVMGKFEELLAKYNVTAEDVTFTIEGLSDEELEEKFAELFGSEGDTGDDGDANDDSAIDNPVADNDDVQDVDNGDDGNADVFTDDNTIDGDPVGAQTIENSEIKFELSHDDIRCALYNLLDAVSENGYSCAWIAEVYDDKFIYHDYTEGKFYRQSYVKDGDNVSLSDNKVEVFSEWLSKEEKDALDNLKSDYSKLKAFKDKYDEDELKAQKDAIFGKVEYECLVDNAEFKTLMSDAEKYSVDEISVKADLIFAAHMKTTMDFSAKTENTNAIRTLGLNFNTKETKKKPYGNLFSKD